MKNKIGLFAMISILFVIVLSGCSNKPAMKTKTQITEAFAEIRPTEGNHAHGFVTFTYEGSAIEEKVIHISASLDSLTPGKHAIHIHQYGVCSALDASTAGGHFNPDGMPHGSPNSKERHVGDLGNIMADSNGHVEAEWSDTQISFSGPHSIIGRSVVIHQNEDDFTTQPSGNAGARVACGVIGIAKENK